MLLRKSMRVKYIHKDMQDLPRNFAVVAGHSYEEALCNMALALEDPAVNMALWQPPRMPSGIHRITGDYAAGVLARLKKCYGRDGPEQKFIDTVINTSQRDKAAGGNGLKEAPSLRAHFHKMALASRGQADIYGLRCWKDETSTLLEAVQNVFDASNITLSTRSLKDGARPDFHVDDGTDTVNVRLLHQLYGRGAFYVGQDDVKVITRSKRGKTEIVLKHDFDLAWEAPPGSLVMIGGKTPEHCAVHSSPFMSLQGRQPRARCLEVLDFKAKSDMFSCARLYRAGLMPGKN